MNTRSLLLFGLAALVALSVAACNSNNTTSLNGAGATFPSQLYERLFAEYHQLHPETQVSYQPVGSGAGVTQFIKGTIDFGASDAAMTKEEIPQVKRGAVLVPATAGALVMAYNLPGVKDLKLSREALVGIYLGKIKVWNDPIIARDNPGVALPALNITVVHRSDGSGTTLIFTQHVAAISSQWAAGPGAGKSVEWPTGIGGKGNDGVTALVMQNAGAIGYIEVSFARQNQLPMAELQNHRGQFVAYSAEAGTKALDTIKLDENLIGFSADPDGDGAYPIVGYSWLLLYKQYDKPETSKVVHDLVSWMISDGQEFSDELGYIPLSKEIAARAQQAVDSLGK